MIVTHMPLPELVAGCAAERSHSQRDGVMPSPYCVEIFRRAFAGDNDAWDAVWISFNRMMAQWGRVGAQDPEDVVQEGFADFARGAPAVPSLVASDQLGPVLAYLKTCIVRAGLRQHRKQSQRDLLRAVPLTDELSLAHTDQIETQVEERDLATQVIARVRELTDELEFVVFRCRFVLWMTPQDIYEHYGARFQNMNELRTLIQRVTRRLEKDPIIRQHLDQHSAARQKSGDPFSLQITRGDVDEDTMADQPCTLGENVLLDYITGAASTEVRATVEQSAACMAAARRLARQIGPALHLLYRADCPSEADLVAYHALQLNSTAQLQLHAHLLICPRCTAELALLRTADEQATPELPAIRRLIEAVFRPPLAQALRGAFGRYEAGGIVVNLRVRRALTPHAWTVIGELRGADGQRIADQIEAATLTPLERGDSDDGTPYAGITEAEGRFAFPDVTAGTYEVRVLVPYKELVVRRIIVGNDALNRP